MTHPAVQQETAGSPVTLLSPWQWLRRGWADLWANPWPGLGHGLASAAFGWLLWSLAADRFWFLVGAFSGFLLVAPVLVTGLCLISRERTAGRQAGFAAVWRVWRSLDRRLVGFGLLLAAAGTLWVVASASLITLLAPAPVRTPGDFLLQVVLQPPMGLFEAWLLLGALLAAPVFASSVTTIPMLLDQPVSLVSAVSASWRAVASAPVVLALWSFLIVLIVGAGMLSALLGLIVAIPWLAHASWHAYLDLKASRLTTDAAHSP